LIGGNCYVLQLEAARHHFTKPLTHQRIKFQHNRAMRVIDDLANFPWTWNFANR